VTVADKSGRRVCNANVKVWESRKMSIYLGIIGIHKNGIGTGLRYGDDIVLSITADAKRHLYTGYSGYHKITDDDRKLLMPLVYEFTATEPKER
jgi:hypothetical protein